MGFGLGALEGTGHFCIDRMGSVWVSPLWGFFWVSSQTGYRTGRVILGLESWIWIRDMDNGYWNLDTGYWIGYGTEGGGGARTLNMGCIIRGIPFVWHFIGRRLAGAAGIHYDTTGSEHIFCFGFLSLTLFRSPQLSLSFFSVILSLLSTYHLSLSHVHRKSN